jgi:hypothetical protein
VVKGKCLTNGLRSVWFAHGRPTKVGLRAQNSWIARFWFQRQGFIQDNRNACIRDIGSKHYYYHHRVCFTYFSNAWTRIGNKPSNQPLESGRYGLKRQTARPTARGREYEWLKLAHYDCLPTHFFRNRLSTTRQDFKP